jgi:DNA-binding transcriptional LysR family regulator
VNLFDGYRYLAALHQHRHFGRAAASCHITQPALSNALRALEEHFGVPLVRRGRQFEGFTPEGEQVLATAHRMLHEQESLQQLLKSSVGQPTGRLLIGAVPTALPMAARFLSRLLQRHPGLRPQLRSLPSQDIEQGLDTLALDLALGYSERAPQRLLALPQYQERYYLLQRAPSAGTALQRGEPLAWADAAAQTLALLAPEMHNRAIIDGVFAGLGLKVQPALETNSVLALLAAVQAGSLAAVLPGTLVGTVAHQAGLLARPLVRPETTTPIGMLVLADARQTLALQAALALARDGSWLAEARAYSGALEAGA